MPETLALLRHAVRLSPRLPVVLSALEASFTDFVDVLLGWILDDPEEEEESQTEQTTDGKKAQAQKGKASPKGQGKGKGKGEESQAKLAVPLALEAANPMAAPMLVIPSLPPSLLSPLAPALFALFCSL